MINDKNIPYDEYAEKAVLGSILIDDKKILDVMPILKWTDFFSKKNQIIFKAMIHLSNDNKIDVITLQDYLQVTNQINDIGGMSYLTMLADFVPTTNNILYYSKIIINKSRLRQLIDIANDVLKNSYNQSKNPYDILEQAEKNFDNILDDHNKSEFYKVDTLLSQAFINLEKLENSDKDITGLSTGYKLFDKIIDGLHPSDLDIIAARPGMGKTAFALNIAINTGHYLEQENNLNNGVPPIIIFSLEMSAEQLVNRMICAEGGIDANHLRTGKLKPDEYESFVAATGSLSRIPIYIDDTPGQKITEIRNKCRRLFQEKGKLGLILVDYLQLIEGEGQENRQQEVSTISRQLKKIAKELKVPVIALSQLSRGVEQRQNKRPMLSDIRESGSIEQDADVVSFLYRDDYYHDSNSDNEQRNKDEDVVDTEIIVEKNRAGSRGTVHLFFIKSHNKFVNPSNRKDLS